MWFLCPLSGRKIKENVIMSIQLHHDYGNKLESYSWPILKCIFCPFCICLKSYCVRPKVGHIITNSFDIIIKSYHIMIKGLNNTNYMSHIWVIILIFLNNDNFQKMVIDNDIKWVLINLYNHTRNILYWKKGLLLILC